MRARPCVRDKAKIEAGEDPEGDGLTDVSDTEDEEETEPWQLKYAASRALSRRLMLRTEVLPPIPPATSHSSAARLIRASHLSAHHFSSTPALPTPCMCTELCSAQVFLIYCALMLESQGGAALRLPVSGQEVVSRKEYRSASLRSVVGRGTRRERLRGGSDGASGSESDTGYADELDPPHVEQRTSRPIDHGRKEFHRHYGLPAARGGQEHGREARGNGASGDEGVLDAVMRAAAAGDIPDVEVEDDEGNSSGRKGAVHKALNGKPDGQNREGGAKRGGVSSAAVKEMMQQSNKGKSSDRIVPQDERPEALQLVCNLICTYTHNTHIHTDTTHTHTQSLA